MILPDINKFPSNANRLEQKWNEKRLFRNIQLGLVPVPHLLHRDLWCSLAARNFVFRMFTGSRLRRDPREVVRRWQCGQEKQKLFQSRSLGWWTSCVVRLPWREDRGVVGWKTKGGFSAHQTHYMFCLLSLHVYWTKFYIMFMYSLFKLNYFFVIQNVLSRLNSLFCGYCKTLCELKHEKW